MQGGGSCTHRSKEAYQIELIKALTTWEKEGERAREKEGVREGVKEGGRKGKRMEEAVLVTRQIRQGQVEGCQ